MEKLAKIIAALEWCLNYKDNCEGWLDVKEHDFCSYWKPKEKEQ